MVYRLEDPPPQEQEDYKLYFIPGGLRAPPLNNIANERFLFITID